MSFFDNPVLDSEPHEIGKVVDLEFLHDVGSVRVDCSGTDKQLIGNLLICQSVRYKRQDFALPPGQWHVTFGSILSPFLNTLHISFGHEL